MQTLEVVRSCPACGEAMTFESDGNVSDGIEWGEARCPNGHIMPTGRRVEDAQATGAAE
jgi:hypothetical protein